MNEQTVSAAELQQERPYLLGIAYRMLGSASDAEDIVQEALLRAANQTDLRSTRAFLTTVVTRLCLDELGSARRRRETYVGPWLPEPALTDGIDAASGDAPERRENVSLALLVVLDRLSPLERAVFVLREIFDLDFSEIAQALERTESACRKLLQRAREHLDAAQAQPVAPVESQRAVGDAFFHALATGDLQALVEVLAADATLRTDHGGKATAARKELHGSDVIARFLLGLLGKNARTPGVLVPVVELLNGAPALIVQEVSTGRVFSTITLHIHTAASGAHVTGVSIMRNPDKLVALERALTRGERLRVAP